MRGVLVLVWSVLVLAASAAAAEPVPARALVKSPPVVRLPLPLRESNSHRLDAGSGTYRRSGAIPIPTKWNARVIPIPTKWKATVVPVPGKR